MVMTNPTAPGTDSPLDELLICAAEELDLPPRLRGVVNGVYERAGDYLSEHLDDSADWEVYPQGSVRLGTVVRPSGSADYDLDAVVSWNKDRDQITKIELKETVGTVIKSFAQAEASQDPAPVDCDEGGRCWTIEYPEFHIDWLPAIPNMDDTPTGIWLTDRKLHNWQPGNPIAYANWFRGRMLPQFNLRKAALAHEANVDIEDLPDDKVRTTLHRLVQILKIHRNEMFADNPHFQPASIIITTLATHTYKGQETLIDALSDAVDNMAGYIERTSDGKWRVENPVQPEENFADRWGVAHHSGFSNWILKLKQDIDDLERVPPGLHHMIARLGDSFGHDTITKAAQRSGTSQMDARNTGALRVAASGLTRAGPALIVPKHTFHGD